MATPRDPESIPKAVRDWFKKNGSKGGSKGGTARAATLTAAQRQAIARKGGLARQAKARIGPLPHHLDDMLDESDKRPAW